MFCTLRILWKRASILTKSRSSSPFGAMFVIWIRFFFHLQSIGYKIFKFLISKTLELFIWMLKVRTYIDLITTHCIKIFIIDGLILNSSIGNSTLFLIFYLEILTNANAWFIIWKLDKYFLLDFFSFGVQCNIILVSSTCKFDFFSETFKLFR